MAEKKKRGFMSWLGFGREDDQKLKQDIENNTQTEDVAFIIEDATEAKAQETFIASPVEEIRVEEPSKLKVLVDEETQIETIENNDSTQTDDLKFVPLSMPSHEANSELAVETENQPEIEKQEAPDQQIIITEQAKPQGNGFFARLKRGLRKTKTSLGYGFLGLFRGKRIDDDLFEELEEQLLIADVGMDTTQKIIKNLTAKARYAELKDGEALYSLLKQELAQMLVKVEKTLELESKKSPFVILMVGVNGVGKTTTIGKLAKQFQQQGKSVMLAAGDTFRAAAVEQLQVWGERNGVNVVAQHTGADSASVIFDAISAAKARNIDVIIADTAGRLQNKANLMEELKKIIRVMKKIDKDAPHEIMLTLDAGTGQNAISQAKLFNEIAPLSGITLTKLDGTAKGGVIFAIADQFEIPIRYIGIGESIDDLRPFVADEFIEALFSQED